ncbi:MAG: hypothetical protein Q8L27_02555 [archaeon]|nr:hypothetical protein [archaeon]
MAKKKKEKVMVQEQVQCCSSHGKTSAALMVLVGVLVLLNAYYPMVELKLASIIIGAVIILCGLKLLIMPCKQ